MEVGRADHRPDGVKPRDTGRGGLLPDGRHDPQAAHQFAEALPILLHVLDEQLQRRLGWSIRLGIPPATCDIDRRNGSGQMVMQVCGKPCLLRAHFHLLRLLQERDAARCGEAPERIRNEGIDIIRAVSGEMVGRERTRRTRYEAQRFVDSLVISIAGRTRHPRARNDIWKLMQPKRGVFP